MDDREPPLTKAELDLSLDHVANRAGQVSGLAPPNREIPGLDFDAVMQTAQLLSEIGELRSDPAVLLTRLEEALLLLPEVDVDVDEKRPGGSGLWTQA